MAQTYEIKLNSGKNVIYNSTNQDEIVFEGYDLNNIETTLFNYSKEGNNLVIKREFDNSSVVLVNYFKQTAETALNMVNGNEIIGNEVVEFEGKGKIYGTFLDDTSYGSDNADMFFASGGADDIYAKGGNDIIYTSTQGSFVEGGKGNDKIYVNSTENGEENVISFYQGDGNDTVYGASGTDFIQFNDMNAKDVYYTQNGNNLVIKSYLNANDSITLVDYFTSQNRLDLIYFYGEDNNYDGEEIFLSEQMFTILGTAKNDEILLMGNAMINPGKGADTINVNGEGTKYINLGSGEGDTTIEFGDDIDNCNVEIKFVYPPNPEQTYYDIGWRLGISLDKKDLLIYNVCYKDKTTEEVDLVTIKDYFVNEKIQDKVYYNSSNYYGEGELSYLKEHLTPDYIGEVMMQGLQNKDNVLDGSDLDNMVWFVGGNKNDVIITNNESNYIETGKKGSTVIYSGAGADGIVITDFSNSETTINDSMYVDPSQTGIYDSLSLYTSKKGDGAFLFFDVATDENNPPYDYSPNLYITKNSNILSFMTPKYTPGFVSIENWFEGRYGVDDDGNKNGPSSASGKIEAISINNGEIAVDDYIGRVTEDVRNWLVSNGKYVSAMEVLRYGTKQEKNELIAIYTKENAMVTLYQNFEEDGVILIDGSNGNDMMFVNEYYTVNGGKGNDKLYRGLTYEDVSASNYTLNGEDGNDILEAGKDTIVNGGLGINVIKVDSETDVTITQGKGKDYIHFLDNNVYSDMSYIKDGNDLIITAGEDKTTVTLDDYFKYGAKSSIKGIIDKYTEIDYESFASDIANEVQTKAKNKTLDSLLNDSIRITNNVEPVKDKYTGTIYNDSIDASDINLTKTIGKGKNKQTIAKATTDSGLTINGGNGNDDIVGTQYSDIIKGGNGDDIIFGGVGNDKLYGEVGDNIFEFDADSDNDIIYSGKGSDTIHFTHINDQNELFYERIKNDLIIKYGDNQLTLSNYLKNPDKHSVKEVLFGANSDPVSLKDIVKLSLGVANPDKNGSVTGTSLDDIIVGGNKNDTLKSVAGVDTLTGGEGNDKLYGGTGETTFVFNDGDGQDTVYMGKGKDTIVINKPTDSESLYSWNDPIYSRNGNNLVITYGSVTEDDKGNEIENKITISNYFKSGYRSVKAVEYSGYEGGKLYLNQITVSGAVDKETYLEPVTNYNGNDNDNLIYTNGKYDFVYGEGGNDNIQINSKVYAEAYGGAGNDIYNVNSLKTAVMIEDSSGFDQLVINEKLSNVNVLLEVNKDGSISDTSALSSMLVVNDATLNKIIASRDVFDLPAGIEVIDAAGNSESEFAIDTIRTKDAWVDVPTLKNTIAAWLSANGYECTSELLTVDNLKSEMNSLITYCNENAWIPYN